MIICDEPSPPENMGAWIHYCNWCRNWCSWIIFGPSEDDLIESVAGTTAYAVLLEQMIEDAEAVGVEVLAEHHEECRPDFSSRAALESWLTS